MLPNLPCISTFLQRQIKSMKFIANFFPAENDNEGNGGGKNKEKKKLYN